MSTYEKVIIVRRDVRPQFTTNNPHTACYNGASSFPEEDIAVISGWTGTYKPVSVPDPVVESWKSPPTGGKFSEIRASGKVRMTPYSVGTRVTTQSVGRVAVFRHKNVRQSCATSTTCYYSSPPPYRIFGIAHFVDTNSGFNRYPAQGGNDEFVNGFARKQMTDITHAAIQRAIETTQRKVVSDYLSGYDLLTELAELPEALRFIASTTSELGKILAKLSRGIPLSSFRAGMRMTPKDLLRSGDAALVELGQRWMQYRYAIMPMVYSYRDITKLLEQGERVTRKLKATETVSPRTLLTEDVIAPPFAGMVERVYGSVRVTSTVQAMYSSSIRYLLDGVSFNPFKTAWELIPLSFVVDWFIGIGDYITSKTGTSFASSLGMCTAVKVDTVRTTSIRDMRVKRYSQGSWTNGACGTVVLPAETLEAGIEEDVLTTVTESSYRRTLFNANEVVLGFNSSALNWKRSIDSLVLSYTTARSQIRR